MTPEENDSGAPNFGSDGRQHADAEQSKAGAKVRIFRQRFDRVTNAHAG